MEHQKHLENLSELKNILSKNTRFLSFSGISGVIAGALALLGLGVFISESKYNEITYENEKLYYDTVLFGLVIGISIIILSVGIGVLLTRRRIKKEGIQVNSAVVRNTLINILFPIAIGGGVSLILMYYGSGIWVPAFMLIFYGIGLFNGSQFSFDDLKILGTLFTLLGLITLFKPEFSIWTWALGFGVLHILYGLRVYLKHERKK